jgi:trigger factor
MSAPFKSLSHAKIAFSFSIEEADIKKAEKSVIDHFRAEVKTEGFRKGKAPDKVVVDHIGKDRLVYEALNTAVDKMYRDFIMTNKIQPVGAPKIDFSDIKKMPIEIKAEVEVFPEIIVKGYEKLKMEPLKVSVEKKEVDESIAHIMRDMKLQKTVERAATKGDLVEVDFVGKDKKGETIPNTEGKAVPFSIGSGQFLPDLEKAYEGMKAGEEKKAVKVKFPKEYPAKDLAGTVVLFDIKMNSVGEVSIDQLDETIIEQITGRKKKVEEFRQDIEKMVERNKRNEEKKKNIGAYNEKLLKITKGDLPRSWIERECEMRLEEIKQSPQYTHDPEAFWKQVGKKEEDMKKQFEKDAEANLKVFLGLSEIIKTEKIELDKDEMTKAGLIVDQRMSQQQGEGHREEELQKTVLNLKIDKYLEGLML